MLREQTEEWRLWHPIEPTRPAGVLRDLANVGPRTVIWLNEAQFYLGDTALGEQVAAGLRALLRDPGRAPVLVLATLWPLHWDTLSRTSDPDRHSQARQLLDGHVITVPDSFARDAVDALVDPERRSPMDVDPRVREAAANAQDGQITQYLAGVPVLLDRYRAAQAGPRALVNAAMDARRLGGSAHLSFDWLAEAAHGYFTDAQWEQLPEDWLEQAFAYVSQPCNGIGGILTRIRPRPSRRESGSGTGYRLADAVEQYGRRTRAEELPPAEFWAAAIAHADPADMVELGDAAAGRGLYRDAAQLWKHATAHGDPTAALRLLDHLNMTHPGDLSATGWVVGQVRCDEEHSSLEDITLLVRELHRIGAQRHLLEFIDRAVTEVDIVDGFAWARLLEALLEVGARDQLAALADHAADHFDVSSPSQTAGLLRGLSEIGADPQVARLAERAAAHSPFKGPNDLSNLLKCMGELGLRDQLAALFARDPVSQVSFESVFGMPPLLLALREIGAEEQLTALADRCAEQMPLKNPYDVAKLLECLDTTGAHRQIGELLARDPARVLPIDHPSIGILLSELRRIGADEQVEALLARNPVIGPSPLREMSLHNAQTVVRLLDQFVRFRSKNGLAILLGRVPAAHIHLSDPFGVASLLNRMNAWSLRDQIQVLLDRDPAAHVTLEYPTGVGRLLAELRRAGATEQIRRLLERNPAASVSLSSGLHVFLGQLRELEAHDQIAVLLARDPARHVIHWHLDSLLAELRKVGAHDQATVVVDRLISVGLFDLWVEETDGHERFRYGRETDGAPTPAWSWADLVS
ncbi:hypothetical protein Aple_070800 [Acrocarpospora pleiomorpha]|uniref:Uncharacterized protein n=1 Tax=Acrocarpospora pleiomorpha TaxID=90975 RepID=A0A5M3XX95_9ACTN|nr:hypothetical protein Aple_070800 [Acrocarpospora pleiomorpha]